MDAVDILRLQFVNSYDMVKTQSLQISHEESVRTPLEGGNSMHWLLGHLVVTRCNALVMMGKLSIWDRSTCQLFIPGSKPSGKAADTIRFETLLDDLDHTQEQLLAALESMDAAALDALKNDRVVGERLAIYATHETYHAGQLRMLRLVLGR